jgi:hypothetical protein
MKVIERVSSKLPCGSVIRMTFGRQADMRMRMGIGIRDFRATLVKRNIERRTSNIEHRTRTEEGQCSDTP